jgi:hypothetical protein
VDYYLTNKYYLTVGETGEEMELKYKAFHLGDILSITHDRLVSPNHIAGVYSILNHLLDDDFFTHQLPRALRIAKKPLLSMMEEECSGFSEIDNSEVNEHNWKQWLEEQVEQFGEMFLLPQFPRELHDHQDPIGELKKMIGDKPLVVIENKGK